MTKMTMIQVQIKEQSQYKVKRRQKKRQEAWVSPKKSDDRIIK